MKASVYVFTGTREELSHSSHAVVCAAVLHAEREGARVFVGCAGGVDAAVRFATQQVPMVYHAKWTKHGKPAGPRRNREMLSAALEAVGGDRSRVRVFAFPAKGSRGTWDCLKAAADLGIRATVIPVTSAVGT